MSDTIDLFAPYNNVNCMYIKYLHKHVVCTSDHNQ